MSAAVAWDLTPAPARVPGRPSRPRLVLVPTGDAVPTPVAGPLRITRAGRLAITLTVAAALVALALTVFGGGDAAAVTPAADHATTVQAGQTLSQIAVEQLPGVPMSEAVAQIQLANNLPSTHVHAGQTLLIPAAS
ncbi:MAG TPA: LysM peptidoglycan-binding domain-containing protein [Pedococcus sp.]|uniref:LysM peptidoglycan-binding domain-containing protein n=1 Tax=Pedococcus sp. TaxID=2860345 RepID=UPI002F91DCC7